MHTELDVIALQREEEKKTNIIDRLSYYCYLVKMLLTSTADLRNETAYDFSGLCVYSTTACYVEHILLLHTSVSSELD